MSAENWRPVRIFQTARTALASIDGAQILCHYLDCFHVHIDLDAYLPGFELPPYIGIKSRPQLSRQGRTHRCRLPPALVLSPHSRNQQRQNGARRMPMAAKCAEMRHESGLGGNVTIGQWAIEELRNRRRHRAGRDFLEKFRPSLCISYCVFGVRALPFLPRT